jgi:hypothetical protein
MSIVTQKQNIRADILSVIKSLTGNENVLAIPVEFVHYTGSLDAALFLSQLLYWSDKGSRKDGFIYKTYMEWKKEIHLGEYEVRKAVKVLKEKGILETEVKRANGSPTCHYRLDGEKFSESFLEFLQKRTLGKSTNESVETEESLTEIRTEIITENTSPPFASSDDERDGGVKEYKKEISINSNRQHQVPIKHSEEANRMVELLRYTVPFSDTPAERVALDRLRCLVDDKTYLPEEIHDCAKWMLHNLDRVRVVPSTIESWLSTFVTKKRNGSNFNSYEPKSRYKTKSELLVESWSDQTIYDELAYD